MQTQSASQQIRALNSTKEPPFLNFPDYPNPSPNSILHFFHARTLKDPTKANLQLSEKMLPPVDDMLIDEVHSDDGLASPAIF